MKRLILIAAISALVLAKPKPETYKETEDFQYSRSSSDDGSKSGFYGAQRGNMGGNYERAHNMDTLAQHQMSGLVRQVDGELGEGVKTRTGSVYTAANSRGIYGSGNYDLSNLQGRNFAEGESTGKSQSHSSHSSQSSRYGSQAYSGMGSSSGISSSNLYDSRHSGYRTEGHSDQRQIDNLQAIDTSQGLGRYESNNQAGYNMKYHTQSGSHGRSEFDQSSANHHSSSGYDANLQGQYITTPVRVVLRPGGRVAIPIAAPTYSVSQNALQENNAIHSDAEVLNQEAGLKPTNKVKHYEASYSYRKQWEKHHSLPGDSSVVVPTENPFPKNSELYEDAELLQSAKSQLQNGNLQTVHTGDMNSNQRAYTKSAESSRSRFQGGYNSQHSQSDFDSQRYHGFYSQQSQSGLRSQQSQLGLSSQQRQSGLSSQQSQLGLSLQQHQSGLSSQQSQLGLSSHQNQLDYNAQQSHFGSQQSSAISGSQANAYGRNTQISGTAADLTNAGVDVNLKPKSYHSSYSYHKSWERQGDPYVIKPVGGVYDGQTSERLTAASANNAAYTSRQFGSQSSQAHQSYSADCDDHGHIRVARSYNTDQELQQDQNQREDLGQETQNNFENLEDLGQQTQSKWDNLQDLGQQTQNQWDNLQQLGQETQSQWDNLQQLGQQTQNQWDNLQQLGQQTQDKWENLEDLGQQTHRDLDQHQTENLDDFGQQIQQATNQNQDISSLQNQKEDSTNFEQQINNQNEIIEEIDQHAQNEDILTNFEQKANQQDNLDLLTQEKQQEQSLTNFDQQANQQDNLDILSQQNQQEQFLTNFEQQANNEKENLDVSSQHGQQEQSLINFEQQVNSQNGDILTNYEQANSPNKHLLNVNNWDQTSELHQTNTDFVYQKYNTTNDQNNSNNKIFDQNHDNIDKNIDSYDFLKPIFQSPIDKISQNHKVEDKFITVNDKQNLFPMTSIDTEHNNIWQEDKGADLFWTITQNQNTNHKLEHNFQHMNSFNNINNQHDTGNPLQGLWDKIDNIAGEITTEEKTNNMKQFSHEHSDSFSQNININHMQNGYSWSYLPMSPSIDTINTDMDSENKNNGHNLFDEETEIISTTGEPILLPHASTKPNSTTTSNADDKAPVNENQSKHSEDEGRGDIGPEETPIEVMTTNNEKSYKTQKEIETLSLTKEVLIPKQEDNNIQPSSTRNKDENTDNKLLVSNLSHQENTNKNKHYDSFSIQQSSTTPTVQTSTTIKNNIYHVEPNNQPTLGVLDISNNPLTGLPYEQTAGKVEIPEDAPQHNSEQQFEDFGQLQSSWLPTNNLQQVHEQQNVEQQFEAFHQHENMQEQNNLQDFDQQLQNFSPSTSAMQNTDIEYGNQQQYQNADYLSTSNDDKPKLQPSAVTRDITENTQKVSESEPSHISKSSIGSEFNNHNVQDSQKDVVVKEITQSQAEIITEKPGFWKSVGNKLSSAKNKVYSWFSGS